MSLVWSQNIYHSSAIELESLLFINANKEIHKYTDTDVAFTQEYFKVSISTGNVKWTRNESRMSKGREDEMLLWVERGFLRFSKMN